MKRFWNDESGQDLIEYALLLGFVALFAGASAYTGIQGSISSIWGQVQGLLTSVSGPAA
jgi:Flp pilus assembly pilin Flp